MYKILRHHQYSTISYVHRYNITIEDVCTRHFYIGIQNWIRNFVIAEPQNVLKYIRGTKSGCGIRPFTLNGQICRARHFVSVWVIRETHAYTFSVFPVMPFASAAFCAGVSLASSLTLLFMDKFCCWLIYCCWEIPMLLIAFILCPTPFKCCLLPCPVKLSHQACLHLHCFHYCLRWLKLGFAHRWFAFGEFSGCLARPD